MRGSKAFVAFLALVPILLLAACQSGSFLYSGSWSGTISDSVAGNGTISASITESGTNLAGTWQAVFGGRSNGGSLTGTINGDSVVIDLEPSNVSACPYNVVAQRSGSTLSGNYAAYNCTGSITGTLTISKQ